MNKIISLVFVVMLFAMTACNEKKATEADSDAAPAAEWQLTEGEHYITLERPEQKGRLMEVFSVFCSVCYLYERGVMPALLESLPADVAFDEVHVKVLGGSHGIVAHDVLAVALSQSKEQYMAAKAAYFEKNYGEAQARIASDSEAAMVGLKAAGITLEQYAILRDTPAVLAIRDGWDKALDPAIKGTPTLIVNNKYMVLSDSIDNQEELNRIVNELLKK